MSDEIRVRSKYGDEDDDPDEFPSWFLPQNYRQASALDRLVFTKWFQLWTELVVRLTNRHGTITPDFNALYRRKSELDDDHP